MCGLRAERNTYEVQRGMGDQFCSDKKGIDEKQTSNGSNTTQAFQLINHFCAIDHTHMHK